MNNQRGTSPRWTAGEIIISKPLTILALTAILAYNIIFKVIDPISTPLAGKLHIATGTTEESVFVISLLVAGVAVSFLLSVILLLIVHSVILARMAPEAAASWHAKAARPKWNIVYSLLLGYVLMMVLYIVASKTILPWAMELSGDGVSAITRLLLAGLGFLFLPYIIAMLAVMGVNKVMVRLTATNQELIEEIRAGQHDARIPEQFRGEAGIEGIIRTLNGAQASTVRGAVIVYGFKRAVVEAGRSLVQMNRMLFSAARGAGFLLTMGCLNLTDDWMFQLKSETLFETAVRKAATHATLKAFGGNKRSKSGNSRKAQGTPPSPGAPEDPADWLRQNR